MDDVWDEIFKIKEVNDNVSRSIGQDLFHLIPLFTNPYWIIKDWHLEVLNEYNLTKNFNISLGVLDECSAFTLNAFSLIQNEFNSITEYNSAKQK